MTTFPLVLIEFCYFAVQQVNYLKSTENNFATFALLNNTINIAAIVYTIHDLFNGFEFSMI